MLLSMEAIRELDLIDEIGAHIKAGCQSSFFVPRLLFVASIFCIGYNSRSPWRSYTAHSAISKTFAPESMPTEA